MKGKWVTEVWAQGVEGVAKVTVALDEEPKAGMLARLEAACSGTYRQTYNAWPMPLDGMLVFGHKITPPAP